MATTMADVLDFIEKEDLPPEEKTIHRVMFETLLWLKDNYTGVVIDVISFDDLIKFYQERRPLTLGQVRMIPTPKGYVRVPNRYCEGGG